MGSSTIGGTGSAASAAATSFSAAKETQSTASAGSLKINYGDASKAERLMASLGKIQQMQTQAQTLVSARHPGLAGLD
jgi:hypothetical protein